MPDQDTNQLTTTATCLPPFDSILRWRATDDVEGTEGETKVIGGAERAGPEPTTDDEVERGDEVGTTDLVAPRPAHVAARSARRGVPDLAETSQNTPVSIQKPTSWDDHDVGLSAMQLVRLARGLSSHEAGLLCEAGGVSAVHSWECISVA